MQAQILETISSQSHPIWYYLNVILTAVGLWKLFPKCGVDKRFALVPYFRMARLAQAAGKEDVGFVWLLSSLLLGVSSRLLRLIDPEKLETWMFLPILSLLIILMFVSLIYEIRIYSAVCRMFGKRKRWLWLWLFASCVPAILWGFSSRCGAAAFENGSAVGAAPLNGTDAEDTGRGLTINLKTRSARDFLRKKILLRDIHLHLRPGRMVLLLGGSGAGKTTLIHAMIGYEKADAKVTLDGQDVYKDYRHMKYRISLVPQQDLIRYDDTVQRTLTDAAFLRLPESVPVKELNRRVREVLGIFGLDAIGSSEVAKLSGGQKKRLSIATEFISDPAFFVLDEPDSGLDGVLARDLMARLQSIARQDKTVLVITHSPDRVADLFDDVIVLAKDAEKSGRVVFFGEVADAKSFFGVEKLEDIVRLVNGRDEGGDGRADEFIEKYAEVCHAGV